MLIKSITGKLTINEIDKFKSDLVIASATIEHVGSKNNQTEMIKNMALLTKNTFVITTPNKNYPLEFHTKLPFLHLLPSKIYRTILKLLNLSFYAKEENLNILSEKEIINVFKASGMHL